MKTTDRPDSERKRATCGSTTRPVGFPLFIQAVLFILFILYGVLSSCKNEPSSPVTPPAQLVRMTQTQYLPDERYKNSASNPSILYKGKNYYYVIGIEKQFTYDEMGRLAADKQTDVDFPNGIGRGNGVNQYTYTGTIIVRQSSRLGESTATIDTLVINQWGYAIASYFLKTNTTFSYDDQGYLLRKQTPSVTTVRTVDDGNITSERIDQPTLTQTITYEYDRSQQSQVNPRALFEEGKGSRSLLTKATAVYVPIDSPYVTTPAKPYTITTTYSYEFDEQHRVKKQLSLEESTLDDALPILTVKTFLYAN